MPFSHGCFEIEQMWWISKLWICRGKEKKKSQAFFNDSIRITNFAYNMLCPEEGPQSFSLLKQEFPQHLLWFRQFNQTKGDKLIKHTVGEKI